MPIYIKGPLLCLSVDSNAKGLFFFAEKSLFLSLIAFFLSIFPGFHARSIRLVAFLYISLGSRSSFIFFLGAWSFSVPSIQIGC